MNEKQFEKRVDEYLLEVKAKLMLGWEKWRDSHAGNMSTTRIVREITDETVDILGWSFWLWERMQQAPPFATPPPRPKVDLS